MILSKLLFQQVTKNAQSTFRLSSRRSYKNSCRAVRSKIVPQGVRLVSGLAFSSAIAYKIFTQTPVALCKPTRVIESRDGDNDREFKWLLFLRFLRPDWFMLVVAVICALLVAFCNVQIPIHLGQVVTVLTQFIGKDPGGDQSFVNAVQPHAIKLLLLYLSQSFFTFVYIASLFRVGDNLTARLRQASFESVIKQDLAYFDKTKTGEIMNTLSGDIQDFKSSFKSCISQGLRSFAQIVGSACSLYWISPKMTAVMLLVAPIVAVGTILGNGLRKLSAKAQKQGAHAAGVADEAIANIRTVRAFAMEDTEIAIFKEESEKSKNFNTSLGIGIGGFTALTNLALNGIVLGVLFVGGKLINEGDITAGNLMSFMVATDMIKKNLTQIFLLFGQYVKGIASGARVFEMIEMKSTIPLAGGETIADDLFSGEIRLKNVTFSYPSRPHQVVLNNLTLAIPPGKVVALCGSSGSGKSTIASLIERFYDIQKGEILIDGVNVRNLDLHWLRGSTIGFISQEPVLFATTILENIRYGRPGATDEEVFEAARKANAHDFILQFEDKYQTVLGERGVTVSGGQKQRIAIARALLKDPQILILDEATSALDTQSEQIVQQTLDNVTRGRTVLVIAHRLSTIRNADIIYVLHHGRVIESGDHQTLTALKGAYWRLTQDDRDEENLSRDSKEFFRTKG